MYRCKKVLVSTEMDLGFGGLVMIVGSENVSVEGWVEVDMDRLRLRDLDKLKGALSESESEGLMEGIGEFEGLWRKGMFEMSSSSESEGRFERVEGLEVREKNTAEVKDFEEVSEHEGEREEVGCNLEDEEFLDFS